MQIGVILGDVHGSVSPREHLDGLLRQVEAVQRNGLTYVTIGHHYLYGDYRWLQPIPTLARIAAELDDHVTLGTAVIQVPLFHPIDLAEELATLDILTRGRLVVGVGAGYREDEFTAFGVDFAQRFAMMDESVPIMKRLWTAGRRQLRGPVLVLPGRAHAHPPVAGAAPAALDRRDEGRRRPPVRATGRRLAGHAGDEGAGDGPPDVAVRGRAGATRPPAGEAPAAPGDHPGGHDRRGLRPVRVHGEGAAARLRRPSAGHPGRRRAQPRVP